MERLSKSAFKLRSGNKPSASKLMGVSPVKHTEIIKSEGDDIGNVATGIGITSSPQPINALSGLGGTRDRQIESSDRLRNITRGNFDASFGRYPGIIARMTQAGLRKA